MLFSSKSDTGSTTGILTVTAHLAVRSDPSAVVALMVAAPLATAVTTPTLLTVATAVLLLVQVTSIWVALAGVTVAVSVSVWLAALNEWDVLFRVMPVAGTGIETVTVQVAERFVPSAVVAVMVAVPVATAVTTPVELTVATLVLLLVHVTLLLVAFDGVTVAVGVGV